MISSLFQKIQKIDGIFSKKEKEFTIEYSMIRNK